MGYWADNNYDSWQHIIAFYEKLVSNPGWGHLQPVLDVVRQFARSDRAYDFRAGQATHIFTISTNAKFQLEEGDNCIWVIPYPEERTYCVKYLNGFHNVLEERVCTPDELCATVDAMMDR